MLKCTIAVKMATQFYPGLSYLVITRIALTTKAVLEAKEPN